MILKKIDFLWNYAKLKSMVSTLFYMIHELPAREYFVVRACIKWFSATKE